jgi:XrtJ-associated TM-motif-TM protein
VRRLQLSFSWHSRRIFVRKFAFVIPVALFVIAAAAPVYANGVKGCTDSPEIPTIVLGLAVSAAGVGYLGIRNHIGRKSDKK